MSRSGYSDDCENLGLWRGAVERAINGKRGQAFLREMAAAMDAMAEKALIADELIAPDGEVCAIGSVCKARGIDVAHIAYDDPCVVGDLVGIAQSMAAEIEYINDEAGPWNRHETPEERWIRVRKWVGGQIRRIGNANGK